MKVRWKRANDGFVESHDGQWWITPLYWGCTTPQSYELWHYPDGGLKGRRVKAISLGANQRECKAWVAELRPGDLRLLQRRAS